ncbi:hypothetical protein KSC_027930 [Ktedonobacter sp. SOSP1-52]|nr:hypothetical protein KSC_027930 [Ktedonobacter sp. SOSP1-52]
MVHSILPWEEEQLAALAAQGKERGEAIWVPLLSMGKQMRVLGKIHSQSRMIQLGPGVEIVDRQVVVLGPMESTRR